MAQSEQEKLVAYTESKGWRHQFVNPTGWAGELVGRLMAVKNAYMHDCVLDVLDIKPDDAILEVGFGHGRFIELAAKRAANGRVHGIDHSETMVRQASKRCRKLVGEGRVELRRGSVAQLPFDDHSFSKVVDINCFHHWPIKERCLDEVKRVLRPGGCLCLALRHRAEKPGKLTAPGMGELEIAEAQGLLERMAYKNVRRIDREMARLVTCLIGEV